MKRINEYACNYSLIRFLPYRDGGELINVGVALSCGALNFLDFRLESRRFARVSHFFPELNIDIFRDGMRALGEECQRWRQSAARLAARRPADGDAILRHIFGEMARPRESILHFGPPSTALATDPAAKLDDLFDHYVRRQFSDNHEPAGDEALRQKIAHSLKNFGLANAYHAAHVGTPDYHVKLPFVLAASDTMETAAGGALTVARKAIKPLNLDRREPSEITQHGDEWIARVSRLRGLGSLPDALLFPLQWPRPGSRQHDAAEEIRVELERQGVRTMDIGDTQQLHEFSRLQT